MHVTPRKYGRTQIDAAIATIYRDAHAGRWGTFAIAGVSGVQADYDGVTVSGAARGSGAGRPGDAATATMDRLAAAATRATGVAVRVTAGDAPTMTTATRANDVSPFNAGGLIFSPSTSTMCSSGFSIRVSGVTHTTTARHCWQHDYRAHNGIADYGDGVVNSGNGAGREMSAPGSVLMFDGAWNNSAGLVKIVISFGDASLGDSVCVSGGNSGAHCNIKVDATQYSVNDGFGFVSMIRATQATGGAIAVAGGDSGGPVLVSASSSAIRAVGMIQAGSVTAACGSVRVATTCYKTIYFTSMRTVVSTIAGASLVVS